MDEREAALLAQESARMIAEVLQDVLSVVTSEQMEAAAVKVRARAEAADDPATAAFFQSQAAALIQLAREIRREGPPV